MTRRTRGNLTAAAALVLLALAMVHSATELSEGDKAVEAIFARSHTRGGVLHYDAELPAMKEALSLVDSDLEGIGKGMKPEIEKSYRLYILLQGRKDLSPRSLALLTFLDLSNASADGKHHKYQIYKGGMNAMEHNCAVYVARILAANLERMVRLYERSEDWNHYVKLLQSETLENPTRPKLPYTGFKHKEEPKITLDFGFHCVPRDNQPAFELVSEYLQEAAQTLAFDDPTADVLRARLGAFNALIVDSASVESIPGSGPLENSRTAQLYDILTDIAKHYTGGFSGDLIMQSTAMRPGVTDLGDQDISSYARILYDAKGRDWREFTLNIRYVKWFLNLDLYAEFIVLSAYAYVQKRPGARPFSEADTLQVVRELRAIRIHDWTLRDEEPTTHFVYTVSAVARGHPYFTQVLRIASTIVFCTFVRNSSDYLRAEFKIDTCKDTAVATVKRERTPKLKTKVGGEEAPRSPAVAAGSKRRRSSRASHTGGNSARRPRHGVSSRQPYHVQVGGK